MVWLGRCMGWPIKSVSMFVLGVRKSFGGVPTDEQLREYAWNTLQQGRVMPGYGHADIAGHRSALYGSPPVWGARLRR